MKTCCLSHLWAWEKRTPKDTKKTERQVERESQRERGMENQHELETGYDEFCQKMRRRPGGARNGETDEANRERRIEKERKGE